jgi:hypothetical protein
MKGVTHMVIFPALTPILPTAPSWGEVVAGVALGWLEALVVALAAHSSLTWRVLKLSGGETPPELAGQRPALRSAVVGACEFEWRPRHAATPPQPRSVRIAPNRTQSRPIQAGGLAGHWAATLGGLAARGLLSATRADSRFPIGGERFMFNPMNSTIWPEVGGQP